MKFAFSATDSDGCTITQTFETDYIGTVVEHMDHFLRGCGFYPRGPLVINEFEDDLIEFGPNYFVESDDIQREFNDWVAARFGENNNAILGEE